MTGRTFPYFLDFRFFARGIQQQNFSKIYDNFVKDLEQNVSTFKE